ncbi:methyl-CpG-binding domain-containing protein 5 isoform X2 [Daucus carota subsp. sativus]|uniref:methyl-CpG-binding domain-containing protein 5 isoform X2 n=1 Tax=Daucus carota subsp. sativus TaxID=79200 RepID=UPI0007EF5026|nr:PREDICTED: methyl-CpG-binding domain-containing protein 5-like isoform X2 [Daucus carota subsp. sativus]
MADSFQPDPNLISEPDFGAAPDAPVGEGSDPKPVSGSDPLLGSGDFIAAEGGSAETPAGKSSETKRAKRPRKGAEDGEASDGVPPDWQVITRTRSNGQTKGTVDRYYIDPKTGQRFRSKAEVIRYLETGSKSKPQSGANATPSETSGKQKEKSRGKQKEKSSSKKTGTGKKEKQTGWNFDFENPPEETTWSLVDGTWKPSIGGDPVPEETVQQWAETFELVCTME